MLSTPLLWIFLPLLLGAVAGLLHRRTTLSVILTSGGALALTLLAAFFPEDLTLRIGSVSLAFQESIRILGRRITVVSEMLPFVALMFGLTGLWALSSVIPGVPGLFRPISLAFAALLIAALGVEPFLYAALLIQTAVLVMIPVLSPPGQEAKRGVLRYLSLQTLAMPFILLAGWLLAGVEVLPAESVLVNQTAITLGLGFALWLAVFPFHSWVPMICEEASPLVTSFLLFFLPTTILIFGLNFIDRYAWLRESERLTEILQTMGALMVVVGGTWTAFQTNLKRAFGYAALTETGFSILAVGLQPENGLSWLLMLIPARAMGFWLWGYTLSILETRSDSMALRGVLGFFRRYPILSSGLLLAQLSIAGFPLLASFPVKIALMSALSETAPATGLWTFLGGLGLFLFTIRLLGFLVTSPADRPEGSWAVQEKLYESHPVLLMGVLLLLLGLFPQTFLTILQGILTAFSFLR